MRYLLTILLASTLNAAEPTTQPTGESEFNAWLWSLKGRAATTAERRNELRAVAAELIARQNETGGWHSDPLRTRYAGLDDGETQGPVLLLLRIRAELVCDGATYDPSIDRSIERGVACLEAAQLPSGGWPARVELDASNQLVPSGSKSTAYGRASEPLTVFDDGCSDQAVRVLWLAGRQSAVQRYVGLLRRSQLDRGVLAGGWTSYYHATETAAVPAINRAFELSYLVYGHVTRQAVDFLIHVDPVGSRDVIDRGLGALDALTRSDGRLHYAADQLTGEPIYLCYPESAAVTGHPFGVDMLRHHSRVNPDDLCLKPYWTAGVSNPTAWFRQVLEP